MRRYLPAALFVPAVLLCESPALPVQMALGLATAGFLFLFLRDSPVPPMQVLTAIVVATLGECVLSLGWGLYHYRDALLPLYVPPGHGLFYALAAEAATLERLRRNETAIARTVLVCGTAVALASAFFVRDQWGLIWWVLAALLIARSRSQLLLSICFVLTMALELLGTAIGNWRWVPEVPLAGLTSANPPSGVGIVYVLLDMITVAICAQIRDSSRSRSSAVS
ncbi:MAG TPA: hypothetical protein VNL91_11955 [Thermoanaerobaculia bacterium]|nr:hypothetical protein [Thermoanaerobaculia bacterium]